MRPLRYTIDVLRSQPTLSSLLDQGLVSGANFAVGAAMLHAVTPSDFVVFNVYLGAYYLLATAQNALLQTPLTVLLPRLPKAERGSFVGGATIWFARGVLPAAVISMALVFTLGEHSTTNWPSTILIAVMFIPIAARDYLRAVEYSRLAPHAALLRDAAFAALVLGGLSALSRAHELSVTSGFGVLSLSALVVVIGALLVTEWSEGRRAANAVLAQIAPLAGWSTVGAVASWAQSYAFLYIPVALLGTGQTAPLAAARLLVSPLGLIMQGWGNFLRPALSAHLTGRSIERARAEVRRGNVVLGTLVVGYAGLALCFLRFAPARFIPSGYNDLGRYVLFWALVLVIQVVRGNASALLQAALGFRTLALAAIASLLVTLVVTVVAIRRLGAIGAMVGLTVGEIVLAGILLALANSLLQRSRDMPR